MEKVTPAIIEQCKALLGLDALPLAWTEKEVEKLGVRSVHSLRRDRVVGGGIPFVKAKGTGQVKYPSILVLEWLQNNLKTSTSTPNATPN